MVRVCLAVGALLVACTGRQQSVAPPVPPPPVPPQPVAVPPPAATTPAPVVTVPPPEPAPVPAPAPEPPPPTYLAPGVHEHQVQVDEHTRRWTTVVPERPGGAVPSGLVVVLHGVGSRGLDMRSTGFEPRAAAAGVVIAYPDGVGGAWNDGRPGLDPVVPGPAVDDTRFLRLLIQETTAKTGVDPARVAVVGYSNGAIMAGRVACDVADGVAAVALVGGAGGQGFEQSCRPARPVAVMLVAGSNDRTVPYAGGRVADWGRLRRGYVAPVEDAFSFWRSQAGCSSIQVVAATALVQEARGAGCRTGTSVVRFRVSAGHDWYRAPTFDTTGAVWDFVTRRFSTAA